MKKGLNFQEVPVGLILGLILLLFFITTSCNLYKTTIPFQACMDDQTTSALNILLNDINILEENKIKETIVYFENKECILAGFYPSKADLSLQITSTEMSNEILGKSKLCVCEVEKKGEGYYCTDNYYCGKKELVDILKNIQKIDFVGFGDNYISAENNKDSKTIYFKKENGVLIIYKEKPVEETLSTSSIFSIFPLANPIIFSAYGQRTNDWHDGVDFTTPIGTEIKTVEDGTVIEICGKEDIDYKELCRGYGRYIIIKHNENLYTRYDHLSEIKVTEGQQVTKGDIIGLSGNTGFSEGPHLDFKVYLSQDFSADIGKPNYERDPLNYLPHSGYEISPSCTNCENSPTLTAIQNQQASSTTYVPSTIEQSQIGSSQTQSSGAINVKKPKLLYVSANQLRDDINARFNNINLAEAMVANAVGESALSYNNMGDPSPIGSTNYCSYGLWQYNICGKTALGRQFLKYYTLENANSQDKLNALLDYNKQIEFMVFYLKTFYGTEIVKQKTRNEWVAWFVINIENPAKPERDIGIRTKYANQYFG
ncbi:MAG: peptidoglycan DD-metalloendopeptidase family protein [Candidatus Nanoarchaeia archaeon]